MPHCGHLINYLSSYQETDVKHQKSNDGEGGHARALRTIGSPSSVIPVSEALDPSELFLPHFSPIHQQILLILPTVNVQPLTHLCHPKHFSESCHTYFSVPPPHPHVMARKNILDNG